MISKLLFGRSRALWRKVASFLGVAGIATFLLWLVAILTGANWSVLAVLFGAFAAWMFLPVLLVAALLALGHRKLLAIFTTLAAVASVFVFTWQQPAEQPKNSGVEVTVLELNTLIGSASPKELIELANSEQADVAVLLETNSQFSLPRFLEAGLDKVFPFHYFAEVVYEEAPFPSGVWGTDIWSRTELTNIREVPKTFFKTVVADTVIDGQKVTVVAYHNDNATRDLASWNNDLALVRDYLKQHASERIFFAGDFNSATFTGPFSQILQTGFRDTQDINAFVPARATWPTYIGRNHVSPVLQLDHILVPNGTEVISSMTQKITDSDHSVLIAKVRFK